MTRACSTLLIDDGFIELDSRVAHRRGAVVPLTELEAGVLVLLAQHDRSVSRQELLTSVWGYHPDTQTRAVDKTIQRLRQKLESDPRRSRHLLSARGTGYRWVGRKLAPAYPESRASQLLEDVRRHRGVVVTGEPGAGKSAALEALGRYHDMFPGGIYTVRDTECCLEDLLSAHVSADGDALRSFPRWLLCLDGPRPDLSLIDEVLILLVEMPSAHVVLALPTALHPLLHDHPVDTLEPGHESIALARRAGMTGSDTSILGRCASLGFNAARILGAARTPSTRPSPWSSWLPAGTAEIEHGLDPEQWHLLACIAQTSKGVPRAEVVDALPIDALLRQHLLTRRFDRGEPFVRVCRWIRPRLPTPCPQHHATWILGILGQHRLPWTDVQIALEVLRNDPVEALALRVAIRNWFGMEGLYLWSPEDNRQMFALSESADGGRSVQQCFIGSDYTDALGPAAERQVAAMLDATSDPLRRSRLLLAQADFAAEREDWTGMQACLEASLQSATCVSELEEVRALALFSGSMRRVAPELARERGEAAMAGAHRHQLWNELAQAASALAVWQADHGALHTADALFRVGRPLMHRGGNRTWSQSLMLAHWEVRRAMRPLDTSITPISVAAPSGFELALRGAEHAYRDDLTEAEACWSRIDLTSRPVRDWTALERAFHRLRLELDPALEDLPPLRTLHLAAAWLIGWRDHETPPPTPNLRMVRRWQAHLNARGHEPGTALP